MAKGARILDENLGCRDHPIPSLTCLAVGSITWVALCIFFLRFNIAYCHRKSSKHNEHQDPLATKNIFICNLAVVSLILTNVAMNLANIFCILGDGEKITLLTTIVAAIWFISGIFVIISFMVRLFDVFNGTIFQLTKVHKNILYGWCILVIILGSVSVAVLIADLPYYIAFFVGSLALACFGLFELVALFTFIGTLFRTVVAQRSAGSIVAIKSDITDKDIVPNQKFIMHIISKQLVLISTSLFITFISGLVVAARSATFYYDKHLSRYNLLLYYILFIAVIFDTLINGVCLMLQFHFFGGNVYDKSCRNDDSKNCSCHMSYYKVVQYYTIRAMQRRKNREKQKSNDNNNDNNNNKKNKDTHSTLTRKRSNSQNATPIDEEQMLAIVNSTGDQPATQAVDDYPADVGANVSTDADVIYQDEHAELLEQI